MANRRVLRVALTGGIATGKSHVRARFETLGVPTIDADVLPREGDFDAVIVTACDPATQVQRLMKRDGLTEEDAHQRIDAQWPLERKIANADYVIRTDGTFEDTNRQVDALANQLQSAAVG